jgi:NADP-dependent 3-hydroxy acid dehydrogenase YdfG
MSKIRARGAYRSLFSRNEAEKLGGTHQSWIKSISSKLSKKVLKLHLRVPIIEPRAISSTVRSNTEPKWPDGRTESALVKGQWICQ